MSENDNNSYSRIMKSSSLIGGAQGINMLIGMVRVKFVAILIGPDAFKSLGGRLEPIARLACFGAATCYAFGSIITRLAPKVDPIAFATTATILAAIMIVPVALVVEGVPATMTFKSLIAILFLGAIPTAAANILLV